LIEIEINIQEQFPDLSWFSENNLQPSEPPWYEYHPTGYR